MNNRDKLLVQASLQMAIKGFAAFNMDALLAATGVAKSNAYYHFASKEELGIAVLEYWVLQFNQLVTIISQTNVSPDIRLILYIQRRQQLQIALNYPGPIIANLVRSIDTDHARNVYAHYYTETRRFLSDTNKTLLNSIEGAEALASASKTNEPLESLLLPLHT